MTQPQISLQDVAVGYGGEPVLQGVGFEVAQGEVYALLGRNGTGKSTLLKSLVGQRPVVAGAIRIAGLDPWTDRKRLMAGLGYAPEFPDAPRDATVSQLLDFCAPLYPSWDRPGAIARCTRHSIPTNRPFSQLSRGQRSMASIALALASEPSVLVLDDPTLGLDSTARRALYEELIGHQADVQPTVLIASHDLRGIETIADRVGILDAGRLVVDEPIEALRARLRRVSLPDEASYSLSQPAAFAKSETSTEIPAGAAEVVVSTEEAERLGRVPGAAVSALSLEDLMDTLVGPASKAGTADREAS